MCQKCESLPPLCRPSLVRRDLLELVRIVGETLDAPEPDPRLHALILPPGAEGRVRHTRLCVMLEVLALYVGERTRATDPLSAQQMYGLDDSLLVQAAEQTGGAVNVETLRFAGRVVAAAANRDHHGMPALISAFVEAAPGEDTVIALLVLLRDAATVDASAKGSS